MPAIRSLAAAAAVTLAAPLALPAAAQEMTAEEVKRLALEAILENPEIVMEAVDILREREAEAAAAQQAEALAGNAERLTRDPNAPVLGNPEGDVTVVEFFDYNCPYCRRAGEAMKELIAADEGVRVLYREWPILGDGSVVASPRGARRARAGDVRGAALGLHGRARPPRRGERDADRRGGRSRPRAAARGHGGAGGGRPTSTPRWRSRRRSASPARRAS